MQAGTPRSFIVATLCFIFDEAGSCLLLKRTRPPHRNQWNAPGGKLRAGETPAQCCLREVREETGLVPADLRDMGSLDCIDAGKPERWQLCLFTGFHPQVPVAPNQEGDFAWLGIERILAGGEEIVHNIPLFLPLLLRGVPVQGKFEYRGNFLERYSLSLTCRSRGLHVD